MSGVEGEASGRMDEGRADKHHLTWPDLGRRGTLTGPPTKTSPPCPPPPSNPCPRCLFATFTPVPFFQLEPKAALGGQWEIGADWEKVRRAHICWSSGR